MSFAVAVASVSAGPAHAACTAPPAGIVAWWPGEGNANDIIGTNNGALEGGLGFATGEVGQAFLFNATNDDVKIPASASLNVGAGSGLTLETWVNCTDVTSLNPIFEWNQGDGVTTWGVHFYIGAGGTGSLYANIIDNTGHWHQISSAAGIVADNIFTHAALTYDETSGLATIYCNGTNVAQSNLGSFTPLTSYSLYLGRRNGPDSYFTFSGLIDVPSIYNRALSSNEIAAIYLAGSAGKCTTPPVTSTGVPVIYSFAPTSGSNATVVVISGTNFSATAASNIVYFGSVTAPVSSASPTSLTVAVPSGALYAPITVTVSGLTAYSAQFFKPTFAGTGAGLTTSSFATGFSLPAGNGPAGTAVGDLDGDGRPDLVVVSVSDGMVWVYRNISTNGPLSPASFAAPVILSMGGNPNDVALADLNGDGRLDIVVADNLNNHVSVFQNFCTPGVITTNSFAAAVNFPVGQQPTAVAVMDLNGDGLPEIVTANASDNTISVLQNTGAPGGITSNTFAAHVDFPTGATPEWVAIGDLDGDGQPDIATENINGNSVSILRNLGSGGSITTNSFAPHVDLAGVGGGEQVVMGDVDGDGKLDLLVSAYTAEAFSVFRNISTPGSLTTNSFAPRIDFPTGGRAHRVALGDFDGDGRLDITATTEIPNQLLIFRNLSSPGVFTNTSLAAPVILPTGSNPNATCIADLNGDGQPDIFMEDGFGNDVMIYQNVMPPANPAVAPVITQQPTNLTVNIGSTATFTVSATGTAPLSYQWSFNHTNLLGATNTILTLPNAQLSQAGSYAVVITNLAGFTNSAVATLTILTVSPTITAQPTNQTVQAGGTASFSATVAGTTPLAYQWSVNGLGIAGATNLALTITNVQSSQAGNYALSVTNAYGSTVSSNAALSVVLTLDHFAWNPISSPQNVNQPFGATITAENTHGITVTNFTGTASLQTSASSGTISNGNFETGTLTNWTVVTTPNDHFVIDNGTVAPPGGDVPIAPFAGGYSALGEASGPGAFYMYQDISIPSGVSAATLTWAQCVRNLYSSYTSGQGFQVRICDTSNNVLATAFTTAPGYPLLGGWVQTNYSLTAFAGEKVRVMFWVDSTSYYIDALVDNVSLQLQSNLSVTLTNTGNFINGVWNGNITVQQPATNVVLIANDGSGHTGASNPFNVISPLSRPVITAQPANLTVNVSNTAMFAVTATGTAPLHYQWSFNHTNLLSATNANLTLPNVQLSQAGSYSVMITNLAGFTNSSAALLTVVNPAPPSCDAPPSGIVAWWPGQGNANDIIGGNNGTLMNGTGFTNGEVGTAFDLASGQYLVANPATPSSLDVGQGSGLTFEEWIKPTTVTAEELLFEYERALGTDNGADVGVTLSIHADSGGILYANVLDTGETAHNFFTPPGLLSPNAWQHVALTYDKASGMAAFYINGASVTVSNLGSFTPHTSFTNFLMGARTTFNSVGTPAEQYSGLVDEVSLYNRALSSNEVAAIYNAGSAGKCTPALLAPVITAQPTNLTVNVSNTAMFAVTATGTPPLSYQWSFNHTNLLGATNATLTLLNVQLSQAGSYAVVVTNLVGFTNSSAALLTVVIPTSPSCDAPPSGIVAWWPGQGNANDIIGGNNGTLAGGLGFGAGEVGQAFNFINTNQAVIIPASASLNVGTGPGFTLEAWINPSDVTLNRPIFEWNTGNNGSWGLHFFISPQPFNTSPGPGELYANIVDTSGQSHQLSSPGGLLVTNVFQHVALTYDKASGVATIYCNGVVVSQQNVGSVTTQTTYNFYLGKRPLTAGEDDTFSGEIDEPTIYNRALSSNEVVAIYNAGSAGKCTPALLAPVITAQPTNLTVNVSNTAMFAVTATGTAPLSYQWSFNHTNLLGATNATLVLPNVQLSQAGSYAVVITNLVGFTNSSAALLTVVIPTPPSCDAPPSGIVAWWPGQGNATDIIGGNNGTLLDGIGFTNGEVGSAFNFNGGNGLVLVNPATTGSLDVGQSSGLTIEGWVNPSTISPAMIIAIYENALNTANGANVGPCFLMNNIPNNGPVPGCLAVNIDDTNDASHIAGTPPNILVPGVWQHVAFTYNKTSGLAAFYANGVAVTQTNLGVFTPQTTFTNLEFGGQTTYASLSSPANQFSGQMDELSLYNRALSSSEIAAIYNAGSAGKCTPAPLAPVITHQPTNLTVNVSSTAVFAVTATGTPPLSYQWSFNHTNLLAATNATLTLPNVQLSQAGSYAVVVTNLVGFTNSSAAMLTVNPAPTQIPVITSFSPGAAAVSNHVTIAGINFSSVPGNDIVYFGAVKAAVLAASPTNLVVSVPAGATYTPITVTVNGLTAFAPAPVLPTFLGGASLSSASLGSPAIIGTGNNPGLLAVGDLDGDGKPDLVVVNYGDGTIGIYRNLSTNGTLATASFAPPVVLPIAAGANNVGRVVLADLDGDGRLDILVGDNNVSHIAVFQNLSSPGSLGTNSFGAEVDIPAGNSPFAIAVADLDGDGKADIVTANHQDNTVSILRNIGSGGIISASSFAAPVNFATGPAPWLVFIADLDGDGKPDVVSLNQTDPNHKISLLRNLGTGGISSNSFAPAVDLAGADPGEALTVGDVDGDGKLDLVAGSYVNGTFAVYRNTSVPGSLGTNSFAAPVSFNVGARVHAVALGDLDGDGKPDLAVVTELPSGLDLYKNLSTPGSFTTASLGPQLNFASQNNAGGVVIADLNGDGRSDVVFGNDYSSTVEIYPNVIPFGTAPVITQQPTNLTVNVGNTAMFAVTATGAVPLSYQWSFNHTNLLGATNATLTLPNVQLSQAGSYAVVVTNFIGFTNSSAALLTVVNPAPSCDAPPLGIVAWWPGQGNAFDIIGNNNGSPTGGINFASGEVGQAFVFNHTTSYIPVPASPGLNLGINSGLTIESWIEPDTSTVSNPGAPIIEWDSATTDGLQLWVYMGSLFANIKDTSGVDHGIQTAAGIFSTSNFQHVALTYDKSSGLAVLYLNGTVVATNNIGSITPQTTYPVNIGRRTGQPNLLNSTYGGLIDELSLYNRALSSGEIAAIYNAGSAGKCTPALLAPVITQQPTNLTVNVSNTAMFAVTATGMAPLSYQWSFNHTNLLGATNATLTLPNVQLSQAGSYAVVVTNLVGFTNSSAALLTVLTPTPPSCDAVPSGIVAWWPGQGNANDIIGTNNGTVGSGVSFTNGLVGQAFNFQANDLVTISDSPSLDPTNAMTIEYWIYPLVPVQSGHWTQSVVAKDNYCIGHRQYKLEVGDSLAHPGTGYFRAAIGVPAGFISVDGNSVVQTNTWYHVAETYDGTNLTLYVNGAVDGQVAVSGPIIPVSEPVRLGGDPAGCGSQYFFNGLLDEPAIYNRALSQGEIQAIYHAGSAGKCTLPTETVLTMVATNAMSGTTVTMPIYMNALGTENTFLASVGYDPTKLVLNHVQLGKATAGAYLAEVDSQTNNGYVGFAVLLDIGDTVPAGTQEVAEVVFQSVPTTNTTTVNLTFGDNPTPRQVVDNNLDLLPAAYFGGSITLTPAEYEADVYPRPTGNHQVNVQDWLEVGRMVAGLDTPTNQDEFLRADCAPRNAPDGALTVADWVQAGRYALGLDPLTLVVPPKPPVLTAPLTSQDDSGSGRILFISNVTAQRGQAVTVPVELVCTTNENAVGLTASYNPNQLQLTGVTLGSAMASGRLNVNSNLLTGKLGLALALPPGATLTPGTNQVAVLQFIANATASGNVVVALDDSVVTLQVADQLANALPTVYANGVVALPAQPILGAAGMAGGLQLSWPVTSGTFQVQAADSPAGPWTTVSLPIITNGANAAITVSPTNQQQYFRLQGQ